VPKDPNHKDDQWRAGVKRVMQNLPSPPPPVSFPPTQIIAGQVPLPTGTNGDVRQIGEQRWFRLVVTNPGGTAYAWYDEAGLEAQIEQMQRALTVMRTGLDLSAAGGFGGIRGIYRGQHQDQRTEGPANDS
jgi:hypothetical protein